MKNNTPRKEPNSSQKRSLRLQQILFGTMALMIILSMLLSLIAR